MSKGSEFHGWILILVAAVCVQMTPLKDLVFMRISIELSANFLFRAGLPCLLAGLVPEQLNIEIPGVHACARPATPPHRKLSFRARSVLFRSNTVSEPNPAATSCGQRVQMLFTTAKTNEEHAHAKSLHLRFAVARTWLISTRMNPTVFFFCFVAIAVVTADVMIRLVIAPHRKDKLHEDLLNGLAEPMNALETSAHADQQVNALLPKRIPRAEDRHDFVSP